MNTKLVIGGLLAALTLVAQPPGGPGGPRGRGPGGFGPGGPGPGGPPRQTVTGAPYSGVEVRSSQQTLANGNVIQRQEQANVYRDSQGRVRRETTRTTPDGQTRTTISISDPVAGVVSELDAAHKVAFQRPARFPSQSQANAAGRGRGPMNGASRNAASQANVRREALSAQTVNGIMASGSRVTHTIPAGQIGNSQDLEIVHETWMSDELKVPVMTKVTDPRTGTSTTQLTNIVRSEPDAALFQVPPDYTVRKGPGGPPGPRRPQQ